MVVCIDHLHIHAQPEVYGTSEEHRHTHVQHPSGPAQSESDLKATGHVKKCLESFAFKIALLSEMRCSVCIVVLSYSA